MCLLCLLCSSLSLKPDPDACAARVCSVFGIHSLLTVPLSSEFSWLHPCLLVSVLAFLSGPFVLLPDSGSLTLASCLALSRPLILMFPVVLCPAQCSLQSQPAHTGLQWKAQTAREQAAGRALRLKAGFILPLPFSSSLTQARTDRESPLMYPGSWLPLAVDLSAGPKPFQAVGMHFDS